MPTITSQQLAAASACVLDWGTSHLRVYLADVTGQVIAQAPIGPGVAELSGRTANPSDRAIEFERVFELHCASWLRARPDLPCIAVGMVGSRNGWHEAPYIECPVDLFALRERCLSIRAGHGIEIRLIPGLTDPAVKPFADVIRGEETQLAGYCSTANGLRNEVSHTVVLPGTHSKWVQCRGSRVNSFRTFVTGELYAVLAQHSFIAAMLEANGSGERSVEQGNWNAFDEGVRVAQQSRAYGAGLMSKLFSIRTAYLADGLATSHLADYLSGLLIGSELVEAQTLDLLDTDNLGIIATTALAERYARASRAFDLEPSLAPEHCVVRGALAIFKT